jgi:hypothetical protein
VQVVLVAVLQLQPQQELIQTETEQQILVAEQEHLR